MDTRAFYRKFLEDLRTDQKKHGGAVANYLPNLADAGGADCELYHDLADEHILLRL